MPVLVAPSERWLSRHRTRLLDVMAARQLAGAGGGVGAGEPRRGVAAVLIFLLAAPMNLLTCAFLLVGIGCLVRGPTGLRVLGVLALLAFVATAPRPDRRELTGLTRDDAPTLFALLGRVADQIGAPVPERVQLDTRYNCAATLIRRRPVLILGAPLWTALPGQARIAVLGHELGHLAHRDLLAGRWVGCAQQSAHRWYDIGRTGGSMNRRAARAESLGSLGAIAAAGLLGGFRALAAGYLWVLDVFNAAAVRRREYLADRDALVVGGTDGALSMFDTLLAGDAVAAAMTRAALATQQPDLWSAVSAAVATDDVDTRLRRRSAAHGEESRVDGSHPRTVLRIHLVEHQGRVDAAVTPDSAAWARIAVELAPSLRVLAARARDEVRSGRR